MKAKGQKVKKSGGGDRGSDSGSSSKRKSFSEAESFDEFLETLDEDELAEENELAEAEEQGEESDEEEVDGDEVVGEEDDDDDDEEMEFEEVKTAKGTVQDHKTSLRKLEESDPEFFAYLRENDADLLNFDDDDEGDSDDDEGLHKASEEDLEVASDSEAEEEYERESSDKTKAKSMSKKGIVTLGVIADWEEQLTKTKDINVLAKVLDALECGVETVVKGESSSGVKWRVEGSTNFNALVRLCIRHFKEFLLKFLSGSKNMDITIARFDHKPSEIKDKNKVKWKKLRPKLKLYISCIISLLQSMGNADAVSSLLKHCHKMAGFWALMGAKSYKLLRTLIGIWSSGDDTCRVLAFMTIMKMANHNRESFLLRCFKQMYMSYVANCKFTSVNSWASINFMRFSLVEVYLLDSALAYSIAFPFIRQLAIHLRNAITAGTSEQNIKQSKKETSRIVYSWQFVHSLHLWVDLLSSAPTSRDNNLKLLIYPIVQLCLGVIKLIPTKKYIPLRFQIIKMLTHLQDKTKVFIPILPLALEVLTMMDFNAKSISKFSVRPLDMTCCLKADPAEGGFLKSTADNTFESILRICQVVGTEIAFPEIVCPALIQLKHFIKHRCKNPEVYKKMKSLIEKIEANSTFVKNKRTKALEAGEVSLTDLKSQQILRIEMENSTPPPPIVQFANEYFKTAEKAQKKIRNKVKETRNELMVPKPNVNGKDGKKMKLKRSQKDDPLFDSDSDNDFDEPFKTKLDEEDSADADVDDQEQEQPKQEPKLKKKKRQVESKDDISHKKSKKKKKEKKNVSNEPEPDDELVDFELSD